MPSAKHFQGMKVVDLEVSFGWAPRLHVLSDFGADASRWNRPAAISGERRTEAAAPKPVTPIPGIGKRTSAESTSA